MLSITNTSKLHCPYTPSIINQPLKLNSLPQVLIDIANSFLTFKEQARLRSTVKYLNTSRNIETLDLLKDPLPHTVLSRDLFKQYANIRQLYVSFENDDSYPLETYTFLKNPKFSNVTKLYLKQFWMNHSNFFGHKDYKLVAQDYFSTFKFSLTDLTLTGYDFDLYPIVPLVNLQRLKVVGQIFFTKTFPLNNFTNLTELTLNHSLLFDFRFLSSLTSLTYLDLNHNKELIFIDTLKNLTGLKHLSLAKCEKIVNIESLMTLSNLKYLNLRGINRPPIGPVSVNPISIMYLSSLQILNLNFENDYPDLKYLGNHTHLIDLSLNIGLVRDFSPLLNLTRLQKLVCRNPQGNVFPDYAPIFQISSLTELHMIGALDHLPEDIHLPQLRILNLRDNKDLTEIHGLKSLTNLETLDLSHTRVANLEPISQLYRLLYLSLIPFYGNPEPLANLINLRLLDITGNPFDLKILSNLKQLEYLSNTDHFGIQSLDNFPRLKGIDGRNKYISAPLKPWFNRFLKNDIFTKFEHELFPMLKSIGAYP